MTVYIEDCLIENFVVTYLIIKCVCLCLKLNIKKSRLFASCIFASIIATFYPLLRVSLLLLTLFKIFTGVIIVILVFDTKNFLAKFLLFLFFTALYGGLNIICYYMIYGTIYIKDNFPTYILLLFLLLMYFLITQCLNFAKKKLAISNFIYNVKIVNDGKEIFANAFLDSGNVLLDDDSTPIFIINVKLFNKLYKDISFSDLLTKNYKSLKYPHYIKSSFATGGGKLLVFCVDSVKILDNNNLKNEISNARLGISYSKFDKNFNCDMLLNICAFS